MNIKENTQNKNQKHKNSNDAISPYNNFNPNELPNADDYINIINDNDSEHESNNKEIINNKLINESKENKKEIKSKINFNKNDEEKDEPKEKSTDIEIQIINDIPKKNKEKKEELPPMYDYDKIKDDIFTKINLKEEIKENFIRSEKIVSLEKSLSDETFSNKKTRKRGLNKSNGEIKKKRGRKRKHESSDALHKNDSPDNIIKKIKSKLMKNLLIFINDLLNSLEEKNKILINLNINSKSQKETEEKIQIIKKIDYKKIVNDMKRQNNLAFLKMTLKEFLSNKISEKYSTLSKDLNKSIINELLNKEKENLIIKYIFNLTYGDWIDIYTYKKEITDFGNIDNESAKKIEKYFQKVDSLLIEIYNLNFGNNYFSLFISLLYNFERWFFVKQNRKRKDKKEKVE